MSIFNIFRLLGGLALFLYGMENMGSGLRQLSGGRLEKILARLTSNPFKALLLGAGVTAVIQSSSATTVMVVGFVNSGLMKLEQVVGIIIGANIGTTITSWVLSLAGLQSSNFFLQLLNPDSFSPLLGFIGILLYYSGHSERRKNLGTMLVGFSILMIGMSSMSASMKPLAESEHFADLFVLFSNPILGVLVGALLTGIIQSSAASIGILQALSISGSVTYAAALPILLGQNIGTCVTTLLSSIGTNKNARRASMIHLSFNFIGTLLFMILFYACHAIFRFEFMEHATTPFGIALTHTGFNLFAAFALMPFSKLLLHLSTLLIKDGPGDEDDIDLTLRRLDPRFLSEPVIAVNRSHEVLNQMADYCLEAYQTATDLIFDYDNERFKKVQELEQRVDEYEDRVGSYMIRISSEQLLLKESNHLNTLIQSMNDFERISDHALNIAFIAQSKVEAQAIFSEDAYEELRIYFAAGLEVIDRARNVFKSLNTREALKVEPLEQVIDQMNKELHNRHVHRLKNGGCDIATGLLYMDVLSDVERISDHCSNVAIDILALNKNGFDTHEYLNRIHHQNSFKNRYQADSQRFELPPMKNFKRKDRDEKLEVISKALSRDKGKSIEL
ncbi:MAG: Na/Pi cotransporter family protein [Eubacteriales bacterium]|nr:Na/Pi cotransporter family protein [Eubacteriales bacterium]